MFFKTISLFGILLKHGERRKVVRSIYSHLKQHDGMSWEISRDGFKEDVLKQILTCYNIELLYNTV